MSIDGTSRVPDTNNSVRNTCRDMIYKAMKKGLNEGRKRGRGETETDS